MALPAYSSTGLPSGALISSWSEPDLYLDPIISDMEGGNKRMRSSPGDNVQHIQFDILYTKSQWATLRTFLMTTLGNGTSRFIMSVWLGDAYALRTVQCAAKPQPQSEELNIRVKWDLWVLP